MSPKNIDPTSSEDADHGVLDEPVPFDTAGIGLTGGPATSQLRIVLSTSDEDDEDDVVDDDVVHDIAGLTLAGASAASVVEDDAAADAEALEPADFVDDETDSDDAEDELVESIAEAEDADSVRADDPQADVDGDDEGAESRDAETEAVFGDEDLEDGEMDVDFDETGGADDELAEVAADDPEPDALDPDGETAPAGAGSLPEDADADPASPTVDEHADPSEHDLPAPADETDLEPTMTDSDSTESAPVVSRPTPTEPTPASRRLGDLVGGAERESADLLTADRLLEPSRVAKPEPEGTWAHMLYALSAGRINIGDGKRAQARKELDRRIAAPIPGGARFVAVISRKGGVGKTTVTTLLGQALADAREDRIIAIDANPDRGTLSDRISRRSGKTVRDLVRERDHLRGYNDVSTIVARDETRLDVLASDTDPHVSHEFSDEEYRTVAEVAGHYYSVVLTDTGTGIVHSVMGATLDRADQLVLVAGLSIDESRLASETLTWLEANGREDQARQAVVVLNSPSPGTPIVRADEIETHFRSRVREVVRVPYDSQIATGGAITFRDLQPRTRDAARRLAAAIVAGLRSPGAEG